MQALLSSMVAVLADRRNLQACTEWHMPLAQSFLRFFRTAHSSRTLAVWIEKNVGVFALSQRCTAAEATRTLATIIGEWKSNGIIDTSTTTRGTTVSFCNMTKADFIVEPMLTEPAFHAGDEGGSGTRAIVGGRPHKYVSDEQKDALDAIQGTAYCVDNRVLMAAIDAQERGLFADTDKRSFVLENRAIDFASSELADGESYWLPCFLDWRGRIYTDSGAMLSYQGSDLHRGLCHFADAKPVDVLSEGWAEFLESAAAEYGVTPENAQEITITPISDVTGNQFRRLACAFAILDVLSTGKTGYIWQQDATCSGMGNMACIMRDRNLAKATALLGKISKADDLYCQTSTEAVRNPRYFRLTVDGKADKVIFDFSSALEDEAIFAELSARNTAKKPVMLSSYGSSAYGLASSWMTACGILDDDGQLMSDVAAKDLCSEDLEMVDWDHLAGSPEGLALSTARAQAMGATPWEWFMCLATAYQHALMRLYPSIGMFQSHMKKIARKTFVATGKPSFWRNSVGMLCVYAPVIADDEATLRITTSGGEQKFTLPVFSSSVTSEDKDIAARQIDRLSGQSGMPPCRIHSEDAAIVCLSVLDVADDGIVVAPIHDSWGTHICDGLRVRQAVRDAMITVHSADLLVEQEKAAGLAPIARGDWDLNEIKPTLIR